MTDPRDLTAPYDPDRRDNNDDGFHITRDLTGEGTPAAPGPKIGSRLVLGPPQKPDELGRLGGYRILEILGKGGMGVVLRAEDPRLRRPVAVKVMRPDLTSGRLAAERFVREARAAAAVKHDHIVTIYQVGQDRGTLFIAMEFLVGEPLDARIKREGRLPAAEVIRIGHEMALGLAAAHESGLIHRDIKPGNVWLEAPNGRVKLLDFGLARAEKEEGELTDPRAIVGTPSYMPIEQANGNAVDHRADIYSLGVVMYRLATGVLPFQGDSPLAILSALALTTPIPPSQHNPEVPQFLNDLILKLLSRKADDRVQTAREVVELLGPALRPVTVVHVVEAPKESQFREEFAFDDAPTNAESTIAEVRPKPKSHTELKPVPRHSPARNDRRNAMWPIYAACGLAVLIGAVGLWALVKKGRQKPPEIVQEELKPQIPIAPKKPADPKPSQKLPPVVVPPAIVLPAVVPPATFPSPLDVLDESKIPESERFDYLPKETVAVLGSGERRTWTGFMWGLHGGLEYSPDGKHLVACDFTNLYLYDAETVKMKARRSILDFMDTNRGFAFSPDGRTMYAAKVLTAWDLSRGDLKQLVEPGLAQRNGFAVAASPDGKFLAVGTNGQGTIVDLTKRDHPVVFEWKIDGSRWWDIRFSPDSRWLIATDRTTYHVLRLTDGKWAADLPVKRAGGRIAYSFTDKRKVAIVIGGGIPVLVDLAGDKAKELGPVAGLDNIFDIAFDSTGTKWCASRYNWSTGAPGELLLGDWQENRLRESTRITTQATGYVALSPDGKSLAFHGEDRRLRVYDVTKDPWVEITKGEFEPVLLAACKPDGTAAATVSVSGQLSLWDWHEGQPRRVCAIEIGQPQAWCGWLPDGRRLVTFSYPSQHGSLKHECRLWEFTAGRWNEVAKFELANHQLWSGVIAAPDSKRAVIGNTLWDLTETPPKQVAEFADVDRNVKLADISPDGKRVVFAFGNGTVQLHDIDKPDDPPLASTVFAGEVLAVRFAPNSRSILTAARGARSIIWEQKGKELVEKMKLTNAADSKAIGGYHPCGAVFSPDDTRIYVAFHGGLTEYDAATGVATRMWSLPGGTYPMVAHDSRHLVLQNLNGTAFVLRLQGTTAAK